MIPRRRLKRGHKVITMAAICCLLGATNPAFSDVVILKPQRDGNPRTLQGEVLSVDQREVLLRIEDGTPDGLNVPLSRDSVLEIIFSRHRIEMTPEAERQVLSRPIFSSPGMLDSDMYGAPVPPAPTGPAHTAPSPVTEPRTVLSLATPQGVVDDQTFILLSRFRGLVSQATYAGLYNFDNKGTFWVRLPVPVAGGGELRFTLFGKQNAGNGGDSISNFGGGNQERYAVKARFIDENGRLIEESPLIMYEGHDHTNGGDPFSEWFEHLDGIAGLSGRHSAALDIPPGAKTIEFRAASGSNAERHLVGYIGDVHVVMPAFARQYGQ